MFEKLSDEEKTKIIDFMEIYRKYVNPNSDDEINTIVDYIFDSVIKVYFEYKDIAPFISIEDDSYEYYIIKPNNDRYSLLDYLINTVIQNLDSIELIDGSNPSSYGMRKKKMCINKAYTTTISDCVFKTMNNPINKDEYLKLYYKNAIYHEIGHMLHYKILNPQPHVLYVPSDYMSLSGFPPLKKRMSENQKNAEMDRRREIVKLRAKEKINNRISMYYDSLGHKYNILNPNDINESSISVEKFNHKLEYIMLPSLYFLNPFDEAFSECDAEIYSGLFENEIFQKSGNVSDCFYIPIDNEHIIMTYFPCAYSISSAIGSALKKCISKKSYFNTMFLGKSDLFEEFLGRYDMSTTTLAFKLSNADKGKMEDVQSLLDDIIEFAKRNNKPLDWINTYFPLVYKNNQWLYYTDAVDIDKPKKLIP